MMPIAEMYGNLSGVSPRQKDLMQFLSLHAHGNVVQIGMENGAATCALLYGVEHKGGHVWTIGTTDEAAYKFLGHPQWTMVESWMENVDYIRGAGVPEEVDLLYIKADATPHTALLILKVHGHTIKTNGMIVVADVKDPHTRSACEEYAKSYGMRFHARPSEADLGVIFYPENTEALKNV